MIEPKEPVQPDDLEKRVRDFMILLSGESPESQAARFIFEQYKFIQNSNVAGIKPRSVGQAYEEFIESKRKKNLADCYLERLHLYMRKFVAFVGAETPMTSITTEQASDWIYFNPEVSAWNLVDKLVMVRNFCNWCIKRGYLERSPTLSLDRPKIPWKEPGILTVEQCRNLMSTVQVEEPDWIPYFTLALFAGVRPWELYRSHWENVKLDANPPLFHVVLPKVRRRPRFVDLSMNATAWLRLGLSLSAELPPLGGDVEIKRIRKMAGISIWPRDCLRHTYCSMHLAMHRNAALTAENAGHGVEILNRNYRQMVTPEQAKEFWNIYPK